MKKILFLFSMIFMMSLSVQAQTPDTAAISEASALYQPKSLKGGVAISATAPLVPIQKLDNKIQWVRSFMQGQIDGVNAVLPLKLNSSTAASTYATQSSVNSKVNTSAFLDSLTAARNNINYVQSQISGVNANLGNVAYVSKNGNNTTAEIGNRALPYRDPVAAKAALVLANIQNGLIEVFPATYMYADTDTATWQMSQRRFSGNIDVFTEVSKVATKSAISLSYNGNYYLHPGVKICSGRFWDSTALALFYDTTGVDCKVYGKGVIADYGTYLKSNTLPNTQSNSNYAYNGGRIFEMKGEAKLYLECANIVTTTHGLYQYAGLSTSPVNVYDSTYSRVWTASDSTYRNYNFKSLTILTDSMTGINPVINMNYLNNAMLSHRSASSRGALYVKAKFVNTTGGGWSGLESFKNYDITIIYDEIQRVQPSDFLHLRNCNVTVEIGKVTGVIAGSGFGWWMGNFDSTDIKMSARQMRCTHTMYMRNVHRYTKNFRLTVESPNHVQYPASAWGVGHEALAFGIFAGFMDTTNRIVIRNTNYSGLYSFGGNQTTAPIQLTTFQNSAGGNTNYTANVLIQNSSFYGIGGQTPLVNYTKDHAGAPTSVNVQTQNVVVFGNSLSTSTAGTTVSFPLQLPTVSWYKPY